MAELVKEWFFTTPTSTVTLNLTDDGKLCCNCTRGRRYPDAGVFGGSNCPHAALFEAVAAAIWQVRSDAYKAAQAAYNSGYLNLGQKNAANKRLADLKRLGTYVADDETRQNIATPLPTQAEEKQFIRLITLED